MKNKHLRATLYIILIIAVAVAIVIGITATLDWQDMAPGDEPVLQHIIANTLHNN